MSPGASLKRRKMGTKSLQKVFFAHSLLENQLLA
jgi:hypothetical protein